MMLILREKLTFEVYKCFFLDLAFHFFFCFVGYGFFL